MKKKTAVPSRLDSAPPGADAYTKAAWPYLLPEVRELVANAAAKGRPLSPEAFEEARSTADFFNLADAIEGSWRDRMADLAKEMDEMLKGTDWASSGGEHENPERTPKLIIKVRELVRAKLNEAESRRQGGANGGYASAKTRRGPMAERRKLIAIIMREKPQATNMTDSAYASLLHRQLIKRARADLKAMYGRLSLKTLKTDIVQLRKDGSEAI